MKLVFIFPFVLFVLYLLTCDNTTESEIPANKLYIRITDRSGEPIENVGIHYYAIFNPIPNINQSLLQKDLTRVLQDTAVLPSKYQLYQNFPNPFNPETTIRFSLTKSGKTTLRIISRKDSTLIKLLIDQDLPAGTYSINWDGTNDSSSYVTNNVYSYQLVSEEFKDVKNLCLNMSDPEHIQSLDCIPLTTSDSNGKIEIDFDYFPINENVIFVDDMGNNLGQFTISYSLQLVFIKSGYKPFVKPVTIIPDKAIELSIILDNK